MEAVLTHEEITRLADEMRVVYYYGEFDGTRFQGLLSPLQTASRFCWEFRDPVDASTLAEEHWSRFTASVAKLKVFGHQVLILDSPAVERTGERS